MYVGSTSDMIALFPLDLDIFIVGYYLLYYIILCSALPIAMNNDDDKK